MIARDIKAQRKCNFVGYGGKIPEMVNILHVACKGKMWSCFFLYNRVNELI